MNKVKSLGKLPLASSSNQLQLDNTKTLNGIKISIINPSETQRSLNQLFPQTLRNSERNEQQMMAKMLGQPLCMPILMKSVSQQLTISQCGSLQQSFHNLKSSRTNCTTAKFQDNTFYTFAGESNSNIDDSLQVQFSCLHTIDNQLSIRKQKIFEETKRSAVIATKENREKLLLRCNIHGDNSQTQARPTQHQNENGLKRRREIFDLKPIAGKLKLSPQYQTIQSIKRGKKEAQIHQNKLQGKYIQQPKKNQTNMLKQNASVQNKRPKVTYQRTLVPASPTWHKPGVHNESRVCKTANNLPKMTIGEKYGITNKKMFEIIQQQIDEDMKEAQINLKDIPYILQQPENTSAPSDEELLSLLNLRNLIRKYIHQHYKPSPKPQRRQIY